MPQRLHQEPCPRGPRAGGAGPPAPGSGGPRPPLRRGLQCVHIGPAQLTHTVGSSPPCVRGGCRAGRGHRTPVTRERCHRHGGTGLSFRSQGLAWQTPRVSYLLSWSRLRNEPPQNHSPRVGSRVWPGGACPLAAGRPRTSAVGEVSAIVLRPVLPQGGRRVGGSGRGHGTSPEA